MSCYFRHMKEILEELGVQVNAGNKKEIDRALHAWADVRYKDCPSAWKEIKARIRGDEAERKKFIAGLKKELRSFI